MDLSIDALLHQRQEEIKSQQANVLNEDEESFSSFASARERSRDNQMTNIFQKKLEFPYPPTPFYYILDKFDFKPDGNIPTFPRLTKLTYQMLKFYPKKLAFSETLIFTILQEMIIHPSVSDELGKLLIRYCRHNLPNYQINLCIWINFISEISISYPNLLVYALAIAHPKFFQQEFTDNYSNDEVIILLLASLLCRCIVENDCFVYILSSLEEYLENSISPNVYDIFALSFDHVDPEMFLSFPSLLPLNSNSEIILKKTCFTVICRLIGIDQTNEIDIIITNLSRLQAVCDANDQILEQSISIVVTYIEKLCLCLIKNNEISIEQLEKIRSSLILQKKVDPTELIEIKDKLHITKTQIDYYIEMVGKKLE